MILDSESRKAYVLKQCEALGIDIESLPESADLGPLLRTLCQQIKITPWTVVQEALGPQPELKFEQQQRSETSAVIRRIFREDYRKPGSYTADGINRGFATHREVPNQTLDAVFAVIKRGFADKAIKPFYEDEFTRDTQRQQEATNAENVINEQVQNLKKQFFEGAQLDAEADIVDKSRTVGGLISHYMRQANLSDNELPLFISHRHGIPFTAAEDLLTKTRKNAIPPVEFNSDIADSVGQLIGDAIRWPSKPLTGAKATQYVGQNLIRGYLGSGWGDLAAGRLLKRFIEKSGVDIDVVTRFVISHPQASLIDREESLVRSRLKNPEHKNLPPLRDNSAQVYVDALNEALRIKKGHTAADGQFTDLLSDEPPSTQPHADKTRPRRGPSKRG